MTKCNLTHPADKEISSHFKFICSINNVLPTQRVFVKVKDTHTHTHTHKNAECWKTVNGGKEISFQETSCWGKMSERKRLTRLKYSESKWTVCLKSKVYNICDTVCFSLIILLKPIGVHWRTQKQIHSHTVFSCLMSHSSFSAPRRALRVCVY